MSLHVMRLNHDGLHKLIAEDVITDANCVKKEMNLWGLNRFIYI